MKSVNLLSKAVITIVFVPAVLLSLYTPSFAENVEFTSDRWVMRNAQVVDLDGKKCLIGYAYLKDVEFENGVIEVDVKVNGDRSYAGFVFRMQSEDNCERFYIRPHVNKYSTDALQYTPVINRIAGWQLYSGPGFTAGYDFVKDRWFHLRMEISGKQARLFVDGAEEPSLEINDLKHGVSRGTIGLYADRNMNAIFSDFSYTLDDNLSFDPPPVPDPLPGMVTEWELSRGFGFGEIGSEESFDEAGYDQIGWEAVTSEPTGLLDIARFRMRANREGDAVFARAVIHAEEDGLKKLDFGYSDYATLYFNGRAVFTGNSAYHGRDPSFLGIIGLNDAVIVPVNKGDNGLVILVAESFGGWGLMCREADAIDYSEEVREEWETGEDFLMPESAVYDKKRKKIYISNYDALMKAGPGSSQFVSKLNPDGEVEEMKWAVGLTRPTGMIIDGDRLLVVERPGVAAVDLDSGEIVERYAAQAPGFLNDIAVDSKGTIYVSDSRNSKILRVKDGKLEEWLSGGEISSPNGLLVHKGALLVGNNGDSKLKAVDLSSGAVATIYSFDGGTIDGIKVDKRGDYLVSLWEGRLFRIDDKGEAKKLFDTRTVEVKSADFEYIPDKKMVVIPTFYNNKVVTYRLEG